MHDRVEELGWDVLIADAQKAKGIASLACKRRPRTEDLHARVAGPDAPRPRLGRAAPRGARPPGAVRWRVGRRPALGAPAARRADAPEARGPRRPAAPAGPRGARQP